MGVCSSSSIVPDPNDTSITVNHFRKERVLGRGGFGLVNAVVKLTEPHKGQWFAMKTVRKAKLLQCRDWKKLRVNIFAERDILAVMKHPFICNSHYCFQDETQLYIVLDLALGGDLRFQLQKTDHGFTEDQTRFYIAQLVLALELLHANHILHRDLKPDNLLLNEDGYIKLSDFGLSRFIPSDKCLESSGTRHYQAPEIHDSRIHQHSYTADWYSVGIITYEFITKQVPRLIKRKKNGAQKQTFPLEGHGGQYLVPNKSDFHVSISNDMVNFIESLVKVDPDSRLGKGGTSEVKSHPWFSGFDWKNLENRTYRIVPYKPDLSEANVSIWSDVRNNSDEEDDFKTIAINNSSLFCNFEYNGETYPLSSLTGAQRDLGSVSPQDSISPGEATIGGSCMFMVPPSPKNSVVPSSIIGSTCEGYTQNMFFFLQNSEDSQ